MPIDTQQAEKLGAPANADISIEVGTLTSVIVTREDSPKSSGGAEDLLMSN